MVMDLTGMEVANASLLDGHRRGGRDGHAFRGAPAGPGEEGRNRFLVDAAVFPQTLSVMRTRAAHLAIDLQVVTREAMLSVAAETMFGCLAQYPDADGEVENLTAMTSAWQTSAYALCLRPI